MPALLLVNLEERKKLVDAVSLLLDLSSIDIDFKDSNVDHITSGNFRRLLVIYKCISGTYLCTFSAGNIS